MCLKRLIASGLAIVAITSLGYADEKGDQLAKKYPVLALLAPPKDKLPPNCKIQEIPDDIPEFTNLKNLAITIEPSHFLIADERLAKLLDIKAINASYFGMYREKNDCGVVGWAFKNVENAKKAHNGMAASYSNEKERFRLWQIDEYVVWLWRDPGTTDECFRSFEQYLNSQLKKPSQPDTK